MPRAPAASLGVPQQATWWQCGSSLPQNSSEYLTLQVVDQPQLESNVVGYVPWGSVVLARLLKPGWLELLLDGYGALFMRRLPIHFAVPAAQLDLQAENPSARDIVAKMVVDLLPKGATEAIETADGEDGECGSERWWITLDRVPIMTAPHSEATLFTQQPFLNKSRVVLAKAVGIAGKDFYLELVVDGCPEPLYVKESLMQRATHLYQVLREPGLIELPWSLRWAVTSYAQDEAMLRTVVRRVATDAVSAQSANDAGSEQDFAVHDVSGMSMVHRTFRINGGSLGLDFIVRCQKLLGVNGANDLRKMLDEVAKARFASARAAFAEQGFGPPQMPAHHPGCHFEIYCGPNLREQVPSPAGEFSAGPDEFAELMAKIHKRVAPTWYKEWKELQQKHLPILQNAPANSHVWWRTHDRGVYFDVPAHALKSWASQRPGRELPGRVRWLPQTSFAQQHVTCHGDLGPSNTLRTPEGLLMPIDFERSCATYAVEDLLQSLYRVALKAPDRREFVAKYIEYMGNVRTPTDEMVDELIIDIVCYSWGETTRTMIQEHGKELGDLYEDDHTALQLTRLRNTVTALRHRETWMAEFGQEGADFLFSVLSLEQPRLGTLLVYVEETKARNAIHFLRPQLKFPPQIRTNLMHMLWLSAEKGFLKKLARGQRFPSLKQILDAAFDKRKDLQNTHRKAVEDSKGDRVSTQLIFDLKEQFRREGEQMGDMLATTSTYQPVGEIKIPTPESWAMAAPELWPSLVGALRTCIQELELKWRNLLESAQYLKPALGSAKNLEPTSAFQKTWTELPI